jgi:hypothetical protein
MSLKYLDTYTCYFTNSDTEKQFPNKQEAFKAAQEYCGNNLYTKPFLYEETYLFGPGDGTSSVMVRQDVIYTVEQRDDGADT